MADSAGLQSTCCSPPRPPPASGVNRFYPAESQRRLFTLEAVPHQPILTQIHSAMSMSATVFPQCTGCVCPLLPQCSGGCSPWSSLLPPRITSRPPPTSQGGSLPREKALDLGFTPNIIIMFSLNQSALHLDIILMLLI